MNFPDVPFDETLFESNEMMRNYWDRATQKRSSAFDSAEEEDELRDLTIASFDQNVVRYSTVEDSQKKKTVDVKASEPAAEPAAAPASAPAAPAAPLARSAPLSKAVLGLNEGQWGLVAIAVVVLFYLYTRNSSRY